MHRGSDVRIAFIDVHMKHLHRLQSCFAASAVFGDSSDEGVPEPPAALRSRPPAILGSRPAVPLWGPQAAVGPCLAYVLSEGCPQTRCSVRQAASASVRGRRDGRSAIRIRGLPVPAQTRELLSWLPGKGGGGTLGEMHCNHTLHRNHA